MDESIDAQIRAIEEYASKNNIQIVKTFIDRAKSATSANRTEFQNMIKYCEADNTGISMVIVHKLDRFSRDKYDSAMYKQKLKVKGIRVVSVLENLDNSPESVILESVIEGMARCLRSPAPSTARVRSATFPCASSPIISALPLL